MPTLTIEYQTDAERLRLEQAVAHVQGMSRLARTAAHGTVLAVCEQLALPEHNPLRYAARGEIGSAYAGWLHWKEVNKALPDGDEVDPMQW